MNEDAETRKELFAWFGAASYAAQCFEFELCILLVLVRRREISASKPEELEEFDTKLSKQTLGKLIIQLNKHLQLDCNFLKMLNDYVEKRNYLVHRFFSDHSMDMLTREGCERMIEELMDCHASLNEADLIAQTMSKNLRKQIGIPEEEIQAMAEIELQRFVN